MAGLKLGPLPRLGNTKLSITLPEGLKDELEQYAVEYSRMHGDTPVATLIPHMLENFLKSDRGWRTKKAARRRRKIPDTTSV